MVLALHFSFPTTFVYSVEINLTAAFLEEGIMMFLKSNWRLMAGKNDYLEEYLSIFMYLMTFHELFGKTQFVIDWIMLLIRF